MIRRHPAALAAASAVVACATVAAITSNAREPRQPARPAAEPANVSPLTPARPSRQGSLLQADALANTRIGGPYRTALAFRFRARWTGTVVGVRSYVVVNTAARRGYSAGTGGTLRVSLLPDAGGRRHVPARRRLAQATLPMPGAQDFPFVRFAQPARVVAGRLYYVVFTNLDPRPDRNYVSVNALYWRGRRTPTPAVTHDMAVFVGTARPGGRLPTRWDRRAQHPDEHYAPIVDVVGGGPDQHLGIGYMEVWTSRPKPIGGRAMVRQLVQAPAGRDTVITGAWLRVRRLDNATSPLELRIEQPMGGAVASGAVRAQRVPGRHAGWVHVVFPTPVVAGPGAPLTLTAMAEGTSSYQTFPLRKGTGFGFSPSTVFDGGYAQFDDGSGWTGWDQWGGHDERDSDLQFALDVWTPRFGRQPAPPGAAAGVLP